MRKLKIWDWTAGKFRSSKIFNAKRKFPVPTLSEINSGIEALTIEQVNLKSKPSSSLEDLERLSEIQKEIERLANIDTGQRYMHVTYDPDE